MDPAKQQAIEACGNCHLPEDAHLRRAEADETQRRIWAALGGPCPQYVASDASVIVAKYLAITDHREPRRQPGTGRIGKRLPLHSACGHRHQPGSCPIQPGTSTVSPETAARGAAKAREALGLTGHDDAEETR
jgi:hypothetical protein